MKKFIKLVDKGFPKVLKIFAITVFFVCFFISLLCLVSIFMQVYYSHDVVTDNYEYWKQNMHIFVLSALASLFSFLFFYSLGIITEAATIYIGLHKEPKDD